jgi:carbamoylphosphate synthase large subunit
MAKVLLIDTNFSSTPIYEFLISSNDDVYVCGNNPNDFLAKSAKNYINENYSDIPRMRKLIEQLDIDFIVPGCNDQSYLTCVELNTTGRFPGLDTRETTETLHSKNKFREYALNAGLPVPRVVSFEQSFDQEIWPLIVKPVDAYSGRGVTIVRDQERGTLAEAVKHAQDYSQTKKYIIEEFVEGQLFSHTAFLFNQKIDTDFIVEEHGAVNPFAVDTSRVIHDFDSDMLQQIRSVILTMARELNLTDGLLHTQFISNGSNFWLIEVTRRCPGDLYAHLIEVSTGYPYANAYASIFSGQALPAPVDNEHKKFILRHTISQATEQVFNSLEFNIAVQLEKFIPMSVSGDIVKGSPFGRVGLIFVKVYSEEEMLMFLDLALEGKLYELK